MRIIISSATIDAESFATFFNTLPPPASSLSSGITAAEENAMAPPPKKSRWDKKEVEKSDAVIVRLEGRTYPVEIAYLEKPTADIVQTAVETIFDIHLKVRCAYSVKDFGLTNDVATGWGHTCLPHWARGD